MVSQHRKEKQERDVSTAIIKLHKCNNVIQRMKRKERTKQGTLASLKFYDVKGYGFAEVEQLYGLETMRSATEQLRQLYGGKGKLRLKLTITVKGVKLYEHSTMVSILQVPQHGEIYHVYIAAFCNCQNVNNILLFTGPKE